MSTTPAETSQPDNRRMNIVKVVLGCTGLSMFVCSALVMVGIIVTPIAFRSLPAEYQERIIGRLPFMASLRATPSHSLYVPTAASTNEDALALLGTPVVTNTPVASPTHLPTSVLATNTPGTGSVDVTASPVVAQMSPTPAPTIVASPTNFPVPVAYRSPGFKWVKQGWNNCGPANLTQTLLFYGWQGTQDQAASFLKPNRNDKNVNPSEMVDFVNTRTGVKALWRVGGTLQLIKRLVSQNFAVIMEAGYDVSDLGWMGHYLTVIGYDDNEQVVYGLDTYLGEEGEGQGRREEDDYLDRRWQAFNRTFIVVYPKEREVELAGILGPDANLEYNANNALNMARTEASMQPNLPWAWFNMGSSFAMLQKYKEAALAFEKARTVEPLPYRMLWYQFAIYEAYYNIGNYSEVIVLANSALNTTTEVEETYYWRGMAYAAQSKNAMAIEDFKKAIRFNPNFTAAQRMMEQVEAGTFSPPVVAQVGQ